MGYTYLFNGHPNHKISFHFVLTDSLLRFQRPCKCFPCYISHLLMKRVSINNTSWPLANLLGNVEPLGIL